MTKYVTEEIELDQDVVEKLEQVAKEHNCTVDEVINYILQLYISKTVTVNEFAEILDRVDLKDETDLLKEYYIIVDEDTKKPLARCIPVATDSENETST